MEKPIKRSVFRSKCGVLYYTLRRKLKWLTMRGEFARERNDELLSCSIFSHKTPLLRKLKDVDMILQYNKITNLKLAAERINKTVIKPGQTFSFWYLVGNTTAKKGYKEGMILRGGLVDKGIGGGMCQMTNLIYWMTLHTPLTVVERHRHGYDVFPDSNRTQPFASGATCFYPHLDLMIKNETNHPFQLRIEVGKEFLKGEWLSDAPLERTYKVEERNHLMQHEFWGGYTRHNEIWRRAYDLAENEIGEDFITENHAIMMYTPFLQEPDER